MQVIVYLLAGLGVAFCVIAAIVLLVVFMFWLDDIATGRKKAKRLQKEMDEKYLTILKLNTQIEALQTKQSGWVDNG